MRKEKNSLSRTARLFRVGFVYLFIFLLINVSFTDAYKLVGAESTIKLIVEEEVPAEETKKLKELNKEYFCSRDNVFSKLFTLIENNYSYLILDLISHFPEKDSPPPKSFYSFFN